MAHVWEEGRKPQQKTVTYSDGSHPKERQKNSITLRETEQHNFFERESREAEESFQKTIRNANDIRGFNPLNDGLVGSHFP